MRRVYDLAAELNVPVLIHFQEIGQPAFRLFDFVPVGNPGNVTDSIQVPPPVAAWTGASSTAFADSGNWTGGKYRPRWLLCAGDRRQSA